MLDRHHHQRHAYSGNAGTASVTGFRVGVNGLLTILDGNGRTGEALVGVTTSP